MLGSVSRELLGRRYVWMAGLHIVAGGVGGLLAIIILRTLAGHLGMEAGQGTLGMVGAVVLAAVVADLTPLPLRVPSSGVQVPPDWRRTMPLAVWVAGYGVVLGFSMLTRVSSGFVWAGLVVGALVWVALWPAIVYGVAFGAMRCAVVVTKRTDTWDIVRSSMWKASASLGLVLMIGTAMVSG